MKTHVTVWSLAVFYFILSLPYVQGINIEISSGVVWKELPNIVAYEGSIPLVYQLNYEHEELSYQVPSSTFCKNNVISNCILESGIENLSLAYDIDLHLLKTNMATNFKTDIQDNHDSSIRKRALDFIADGLQFCCGVATHHKLLDLAENEKNLEKTIKRLTLGVSSTIQEITKQSTEFKDYEKKVTGAFTVVEQKIKAVQKEFNKIKVGEELQNNYLTTLFEYSFNNLRRLISVTRLIRTNSILMACRQHQIPSSVLEPSILKADLTKLEAELLNANQALAISIQNVNRYYQLPICDCAFTDNKITINVRIPIKSFDQSWKLYELLTASFAWYNQTCKLNHDTLYLAEAQNSYGKSTLRAVSGVALHQCRVYEDKLCYIPRLSTDGLHGPLCAMKMFTGDSIQNLSKYCTMTCHPSTAMLILETGEEEFLITHPSEDTTISCPTETRKLIKPQIEKLGPIKLSLPCSCNLSVGEDLLIPTRYPCLNNLSPKIQMIHVIPAIWSNLKSFLLKSTNHNPPTYQNFSESINLNWTLDTPHINITSHNLVLDNVRRWIEEQEPRTTLSFADNYGYHGHSIFLIWNSLLTIILGYVIYKYSKIPIITVAPANGELGSGSQIHHDILIIATYVLVLLSAAIGFWWLFKKLYKHKTRVTGVNQTSKNLIYELHPRKPEDASIKKDLVPEEPHYSSIIL